MIGITNFNYDKTEEEIIKNWSKLGFTNGLNGDLLNDVCLAFERGGMMLIRPKFNYEWGYEYEFYRIIRRVMCFIASESSNKFFLVKEFGNPEPSIIEIERKKKLILKYFDVEFLADEINYFYNNLRGFIDRTNNDINNISHLEIETETIDFMSIILSHSICRRFKFIDKYELKNGKILLFTK